MGSKLDFADFRIETRIADAARGDAEACFDLGVAYSSGINGIVIDLVEAHKWFNLASLAGSERAKQSRADIADEMSAREIAAAQRQARAWLTLTARAA